FVIVPDRDGQIALDSPTELPVRARDAETFIIGLPADADVRRVRILVREHPHARWESFADASGIALGETAAGIVVRRGTNQRPACVDQWRIELSFANATPRILTRVAALVARAA